MSGPQAVLLAMVANSLITNPRWEWGVVWAYLGEVSIVEGVWMTIKLTLITAVLGFALGTVLALGAGRARLPLQATAGKARLRDSHSTHRCPGVRTDILKNRHPQAGGSGGRPQ